MGYVTEPGGRGWLVGWLVGWLGCGSCDAVRCGWKCGDATRAPATGSNQCRGCVGAARLADINVRPFLTALNDVIRRGSQPKRGRIDGQVEEK
ncbi:hypothetical protein JOL62DRAFT_577238 [Phyllosticta paracitricarpa]|uniref:Uncharacterized protein n=2 Tax=Phyllosticta TaxID=121621 RepID=A0ABR1MC21_9PEZI